MEPFVLLLIAVGAWCVYVSVGAVKGMSAAKQVRELETIVGSLRNKIADLETAMSGRQSRDTDPREQAEAEGPEQAVEPEPGDAEYMGTGDGGFTARQLLPGAAPAAVPAARSTLEQKITSKWFVWLGGIALALSGIFLVKYSFDLGLLGPATRVSLGTVMAVGFAVAGEWIRRRQPAAITAISGQPLIPAALSAAGVATAFGSIYAGYALYSLFSSTVAFACLFLVAAVSILLSMLHGPFVAALGLVGAYLIPVLVSTGSHSAWRLFLFLTVINAGGLIVVRHFAWRWLQITILAVAVLWALFWVVLNPGGSDVLALSTYLLILLMLVFVPVLLSGAAGSNPFETNYNFAAAIGVTLVFAFLVVRAEHDLASQAGFYALSVVLLTTAWRNKDFERLVFVGAVASVLILVAWKWQDITFIVSAPPGGPKVYSVDPVSIRSLWMTALLFGALFGLAGFAGLWRARRPGVWAAVSAATPVVMFAVLYWRAFNLEVDFRWSATGMLLAGLALLCAWFVSKHRAKAGFDEALGAYAVAVVASIALAAAMALRDAWLTVALAVTVPAIAWIYARLGVAALRYTAASVALIVLVRLALNLYIFDYPLDGWLGVNWILYGYGVPSLAFYVAARLFRRSAEDGRLVMLLESASLLFFVLLLSFEIRHLVGGGRLDAGWYGFTEQALQSAAWGVTALGLLRQYGKGHRPVPLWGYRILGSLAIAQIVLLQCLLYNPLWRPQDVGAWPILNTLLIAYLIPAALCILASRECRRQMERTLEQVTGGLGLVLVFVYISLEFRHIFRGGALHAGSMGDAELYGYSICWLILAGILLFLAVLKKIPAMRFGSVAVTLLVIGKVFLVDMSNLTGLYRAGSFLALGIVLLGIGYFYQRFVFAPPAPEEPA